MKILGIMGSPRKEGNTDILLDVTLEEARSRGVVCSKILLRDKRISYCRGCLKCAQTGRCVIKDDMREVYAEILESDGIIWATPVHAWNVSSLTKIAMDRTYALTSPKLQMANKVGGLITVAARRGWMNVANLYHMFCMDNHMFATEFVWGQAREKGEIEKDLFAINMAKEMAHQMISFISSNLKFPEEFDVPMHKMVTRKLRQTPIDR
jgi:multimeric flavodoxin WrbA